MPAQTWFIFDLGNVVIRLGYERVVAAICEDSSVGRDELVALLEEAGGYRDLERGDVDFPEFYEFLVEQAGYRAGMRRLLAVWSDFFDGPIDGIEELLERVRKQYRVAFLSNSNEVHAELIPRKFAVLFSKDDRFIFSHRLKVAKPDPAIFIRALETLGALPGQVIFTDDLLENVIAARYAGIMAFQFRSVIELVRELEEQSLLAPQSGTAALHS